MQAAAGCEIAARCQCNLNVTQSMHVRVQVAAILLHPRQFTYLFEAGMRFQGSLLPCQQRIM
jgi:hypothetical protein